MATDHTWTGGIPVATIRGRRKAAPDLRTGCCPVCRRNLFEGQATLPAPRPLLGRVHGWCIKIDQDGVGER